MPAATTKDPNTLLYLAITQVMQAVEKVSLGGRNQQQRYDFATDPDMVLALRGAMAAHGLVLLPVRVDLLPIDTAYQTGRGANMWRVTGIWTWRLTHSAGGSIDYQTLGCGTDTGDKAVYKAMTGAKKYALEQAFLIARTNRDDPEQDTPSVDRPAQRQQPAQNAPQARPAPTPTQPRPAPQQPAQPRQAPGRGNPVSCPECGTGMWPNLETQRPDGSPSKRNFKCKDREKCGIVVWETDLQGQAIPAFLDLLRQYDGEMATGPVTPAEEYDEMNPPPPDEVPF